MKNNTNLKEFATYASLNVLGMIGLSCYILADTFFVAQELGHKRSGGIESCNSGLQFASWRRVDARHGRRNPIHYSKKST